MLTAAIATVFAQADPSYALPPGATVDLEVFIAAAATENGLIESIFKNRYCQSGTYDQYNDASGPPPVKVGTTHVAMFCTLDNTKITGLSKQNPNVVVHLTNSDSNNGSRLNAVTGSVLAVVPVMEKIPLDVMNINAGNCAAPAGTETFYRCTIRPNTTDIFLHVPDAGVSEVEPGAFYGPNTADGIKPVDGNRIASLLTVTPGAVEVIGINVTRNLRDALQLAQIAAGALPDTCGAGDETETCMPSLDKPMLSSIFSGNLGKWDRIYFNGQPLTSYGTAPANAKVYICRRTNGAGNQVMINSNLLNTPCDAGALSPALTSNVLAGPVIVQNTTTANQDKCLVDFQSGTNSSGGNASLVSAWAIGFQALDKNVNETLGYRFIKVDGVAPTLSNTAKGRYSLFGESVWTWPKVAGPAGDTLAILQKLALDSTDPTLLATANASLTHSFGSGMYLAPSILGWVVDVTGQFNASAPVMPYTRGPNGLGLDNCRVPVLDSNTISGQ